MKLIKYTLFIIFAFNAVTANANVYMGVGAGWTNGRAKFLFTHKVKDDKLHVKIKGTGLIGDMYVGLIDYLNAPFFWTQQFSIAFDTAKPKKFHVAEEEESTHNTTRQYAATAKIGYGMKIDPVWAIAVNAGLAESAFIHETKLSDETYMKHKHVLGFAAGLGIYKFIESFNIGIEYEYTKYQNVKKDIFKSEVNLKVKSPQYHSVMVKLSKTF